MANIISWDPILNVNVDTYLVEAGPRASGPWQTVATVTGAMTGTNPGWNATAKKFTYTDETLPFSTWWRIIPADASNVLGVPGEPFLAQDIPFFVPGITPFGAFDNDQQFASEADNMVDFTKRKLGHPVMEVHLSSSQVYAALEEACLEYSAQVNSYQAKSTLANLLGSPTGTLSGTENKYTQSTFALEQKLADAYATEAKVNSNQPVYSGSIQLHTGQQVYDMQALLAADPNSPLYDPSGSIIGRIRFREVYHRSPLQAYRFFGTTSGLNYLNSQFRFESFTPETLFYLLPIWEDILRGMQFKTSNNVRRSNYSYALHNNKLCLYPVPQMDVNLWFTYTVDQNATEPPSGSLAALTYNGVSNLSNVPFGNIQYSNLNSIARHWIRRMAFALSKEIEGQIRAKMATIPIPNGDLTLNGPELIADARAEMETLRAELKDILEETTYAKLMEREAQMAQYLEETWKKVPMGIFIG